MYNQHPEYEALIARQRYDGYLKELDEIRLAAQLPPRPSLLRQGANWSGQMLIWVGTHLTTYGRNNLHEQPMIEA